MTNEQLKLVDEYEAGLRKMEAAGYEEFGPIIERHKLVIAALRAGGFSAKIRNSGKVIWLGRFDDPAKAARTYDEKARVLHGEFAFLNFPNEGNAP